MIRSLVEILYSSKLSATCIWVELIPLRNYMYGSLGKGPISIVSAKMSYIYHFVAENQGYNLVIRYNRVTINC